VQGSKLIELLASFWNDDTEIAGESDEAEGGTGTPSSGLMGSFSRPGV
jgi:hypothetical protein